MRAEALFGRDSLAAAVRCVRAASVAASLASPTLSSQQHQQQGSTPSSAHLLPVERHMCCSMQQLYSPVSVTPSRCLDKLDGLHGGSAKSEPAESEPAVRACRPKLESETMRKHPQLLNWTKLHLRRSEVVAGAGCHDDRRRQPRDLFYMMSVPIQLDVQR